MTFIIVLLYLVYFSLFIHFVKWRSRISEVLCLMSLFTIKLINAKLLPFGRRCYI